MAELRAFQQAFSRALLGKDHHADDHPPRALQLLLRVHRNTTIKGQVDALAANFPTVVQLVGDEWFRACAGDYVHSHPATSPVLMEYGQHFATFLRTFPPAAALPYLPDIAHIDRQWIDSCFSADAPALDASALRRLTDAELGGLRLTLHPATRVAWVRHSAATIWMHHRDGGAKEIHVDDSDEGLLLTRPAGQVLHRPLDAAAVGFLEALRRGETLGDAAATALRLEPATKLAELLAAMLRAGAFGSYLETAG